MKQIKVILFVFLNLVSCARIQTLNMKPHSYASNPDLIIWYYVAGLHEDQIPLIKFNGQQSDLKTWFDEVDCNGKMYNYNLFELRPNADKSFLAQFLGSKNIKKTCEDFDRPSIVGRLKDNFQFYMLENGVSKDDSFENYINCNVRTQNEFKNLHLFKMTASPYDKNFFHFQDRFDSFQLNNNSGILYDRACQTGVCYSTVINNVKMILSTITKNNQSSVLIIRDNSYLDALKKKNFSLAKEKLIEIDQNLKWIETISRNSKLVLMSAGESINLDFPSEGRNWEEYIKSSKGISYRNSTLSSPVYSKGALAENFCGNFEEFEFLSRLTTRAVNKKLDWDLINPFN